MFGKVHLVIRIFYIIRLTLLGYWWYQWIESIYFLNFQKFQMLLLLIKLNARPQVLIASAAAYTFPFNSFISNFSNILSCSFLFLVLLFLFVSTIHDIFIAGNANTWFIKREKNAMKHKALIIIIWVICKYLRNMTLNCRRDVLLFFFFLLFFFTTFCLYFFVAYTLYEMNELFKATITSLSTFRTTTFHTHEEKSKKFSF